jgi:hypothetical protein
MLQRSRCCLSLVAGGRGLQVAEGDHFALPEQRGGTGDPGPDPGLEVPADPRLDLSGAALGLEALEIEAKSLSALPEVGIVDPSTIGEQRVDHLEELPLTSRRLGGGVQDRRARMLAGHRQVAKDEQRWHNADSLPASRTVRAAEIGVDDQLLPVATDVIVGPERGDCGAG